MIVSLMLFFMGVGSRVSKVFVNKLIQKFLIIELLLSILVSYSSLAVYSLAGHNNLYGVVIYAFCMLIGFLIGLEIPLVMRINEEYEDLKTNISSVLEKDYYGSLLGGVFFAFIGLRFLGLTYTPFLLGFINLSVAILVAVFLVRHLDKKERLKVFSGIGATISIISIGLFSASPVVLWADQVKYRDKVVYTEQTDYQKIVITEWREQYWLYLNSNLQFASMDEALYHEPLVHPAMNLVVNPKNILVLGGGDGCAVRELLKYQSIESIQLVDLDPAMTTLAQTNKILLDINQGALNNPKVEVINQDAFKFMSENKAFYDVILIDLPDPRSVELGRLYTNEFYHLCYRSLRTEGVVITQAGSPYYATKAFYCIDKTMESSGFVTAQLNNQILSMGQWGWILGVKSERVSKDLLKLKLRNLTFDEVQTNWIDKEAMLKITSFGKSSYFIDTITNIDLNTIHNPALYEYYLKGNWDLY
jgi:spermidine synthase